VKTMEAQFGSVNSRTGDALLTYGTALAAEGRYDEARPALLAAQAALDQSRAANPVLAARARAAVRQLPR